MFWFGLIVTLLAGGAVVSVCERMRLSETKSGIAALPVMAVVAASFVVLSSSGEAPTPKTPAELRQERIELQFSAWDGSHRNLVERVKSAMNDPDSFEHVDTTYIDRRDDLFLRMKFRGSNTFGGKVLNEVMASADLDGKILSVEMAGP